MNESRSTEKRRFRKRWLLLPVLGIGLLIMLVNFGESPQLNADKFSEDLKKAAPEMNLRIVAESGRWFNWTDLPLLTQLNISYLTLRGPLIVMTSNDVTSEFFVEDGLTKTNYEIDMNVKDSNVVAVAVRYPESRESRADQIGDELRKRFNGVRVYLRKGFLISPITISRPNTNLATSTP